MKSSVTTSNASQVISMMSLLCCLLLLAGCDGTSDDIIKKLTSLENKKFISEEHLFDAVKRSIGAEHTKRYKTLFMVYAQFKESTAFTLECGGSLLANA
jgi:hypothetical protein